MNFSQLHERLRLEVARRIHRGLLTGSSLAAQTGLQPSHISNFLRRNRKLSLSALDRVLIALSLNIDDLVPRILEGRSRGAAALADEAFDHIPLVSHAAAIHSPPITESVTLELIRVPAGALNDLRPRRAPARRGWQRFVAVRVGPDQRSRCRPFCSHSRLPFLTDTTLRLFRTRRLNAISMALTRAMLSSSAMSASIQDRSFSAHIRSSIPSSFSRSETTILL